MSDAELQIPAEKNIYLCLSGGGFRATFFHLGVIRSLRKNNLLTAIKTVCAVSGGSIAAAHLVNRWADFIGDDEQFEAACSSLVELGKRDVRGRIMRRWFLSLRWIGYGRVKSLAKEYRRFFGRKSIADIYRTAPVGLTAPIPDVHFLATSFTSGRPCSFSSDAFSTLDKDDGFNDVSADLIELDLAVAASSAFPPMFPPVWLTNDELGQTLGADEGIYLTDGGVYDNLGIDYCTEFIKASADENAAIVLSNAGGAFDVRTRGFSWILPRTTRTTEIMMWRAATKTIQMLKTLEKIPSAHISIDATSEKSPLPVTVQHFIRQVRTDLDNFSTEEIAIISAHGEAIADTQLSKTASPFTSNMLNKMTSDRMLAVVKTARKRKWLNFADPATYAVIALPFFLAFGAFLALSSYYTVQTALIDKAADVTLLQDQKRDLEQKVAKAPQLDVPAPTSPSDFTVYIQFAGFKRSAVVAAAKALADEHKWTIPAVEQGGERTGDAAGKNEIRISDQDYRDEAEILAGDLVKTGLVDQRPTITLNGDILPRTMEVWVGLK